MKRTMTAIRIDIQTELQAINDGQCGSCRLGATHQPTEACYKHTENYATMEHCGKCNYLYNKNEFAQCPVCENLKEHEEVTC